VCGGGIEEERGEKTLGRRSRDAKGREGSLRAAAFSGDTMIW